MVTKSNLDPGANRALFFATTAFAVSFAVWGLIAALAPTFTEIYGLSGTAKSILIAIPVLLGSVGRLPAGLLADRFGGRRVFSALLLVSAVPAAAIGFTTSYLQLVVFGFFLGLAGTTFSVGVGFVSKWFPPEKQGAALGVYGMGNIGQSAAVFGAPVMVAWLGSWRPVYFVFAAAALVWGVVFYAGARDASVPAVPRSFSENLRVLRTERMAWVLSLFYFLTFGGFVAFAIYLPTLLRELFGLTAADAGARAAGFVVLATMARPVGGWLADRYGGARILLYVFAIVALMAVLMGCRWMPTFTVAALSAATALGLGNGAVFKLVPEYFPRETGTVTGLVGAFGGLGGFFPPLALGVIRDATGGYVLGFIFLAVFALGCWVVNYAVLIRRSESLDRVGAGARVS